MPEPCDILFISNEFPPGPGGLGEHAYQVCRGLGHLGYQLIVATNQDYSDPESIDHFNNQVGHPFELKPFTKKAQRFSQVSGKLHDLWQLCREHKPKLIMCSGSMSTMYASFISRVMKVPRLVFVHGPEYQSAVPPVLGRYMLKGSRKIAVSNNTKDLLANMGVKQNVHVVNNGGDTQQFSLEANGKAIRDKWKLKGKFVLLTVGRLCERKGQETVIQALRTIIKKYPNVVYIMVGHEEKKSEFQKLAKDNNLEKHVLCIGQVNHEELPKYYAASDLYILNSKLSSDGDHEGFGISIIEAALCGKAAIGSRGCGIEDAIEDQKSGLLVDSQKPEQTADAILNLMNDNTRLKEMSTYAQKRALEHFTWDNTCLKIKNIIEDTVPCPVNC